MTTASSSKVLIVGGYGQVGRALAELLAPGLSGRIIIAGRDATKAHAAAAEIGHGTSGRVVDLFATDSGDVLDGVGLVVVCLDQEDTSFVESCLTRGIHYVDISARFRFLRQVEALDGVARRNGATALLSVGVSPGLTNLLAARVCNYMERVDQIDIVLELGLGDRHGRAAVEWTLDNLDAEFDLVDNGEITTVRSLGERLDIRGPGTWARGPAYRFNFSDQHVLGRTLDVPRVSSWLRFSSRALTWLMAKTAGHGLGWLLRRRWCRRLAVWLLTTVHLGSDRCGVAVRAMGRTTYGAHELTVCVAARKEAFMTASVTAEVVRQVLAENLEAGVFHTDQVISLDPVIAALKRELPETAVSLPSDLLGDFLEQAGKPAVTL